MPLDSQRELLVADPQRGLAIYRAPGYSQDEIELLEATVWGTGGTLFRYADGDLLRDDMAHWPRKEVLRLEQNGRLVGTYLLGHKASMVGGHVVPAVYRTLFAVVENQRGRGLGRYLMRAAYEHAMGSRERVVSYGRIDEDNRRTIDLAASLGHEPIARLRIISFARGRPARRGQLAMPRPQDRARLLDALNQLHRGHSLTDFDDSLDLRRYRWLDAETDHPVGVQIKDQHMEVLRLPRLGDTLAMRIMPHLPFARRVFDPKSFRHLYLHNLLVPEGREQRFFDLLESVLAAAEEHGATLLFDERSPIYRRLASANRFGLLQRVAPDTGFLVVGKAKGLDDDGLRALREEPLVASGLDT